MKDLELLKNDILFISKKFFSISFIVLVGIIIFYTFRESFLSSYVIVTESMFPTIQVNDAIIVKKIVNDSVSIGDIITFDSQSLNYDVPVTHRVVGKKILDDGSLVYETKGDNNSVVDSSFVSPDNIYGKVICTIPKLGYVRRFLTSSKGFLFSIIIPIISVFCYEIFRVVDVIRNRNNQVIA